MNPILVIVVSASLAFISIAFVLVRLAELRKIRSVVDKLKASDRQFSTQLNEIEEIVGRLGDDSESTPNASGHGHEGSAEYHLFYQAKSSSEESQSDWAGLYVFWMSSGMAQSSLAASTRVHDDEMPLSVYYDLREKVSAADYMSGENDEHWEDMIAAGR